jgi:hypothetical protein
VNKRRAGMILAGGVAIALVAATPALAAGTWQVDSSPNPAGTNGAQLNAVYTASRTEAWAVGQAQVTGGETALIEEWNGSSWSIVPGAPASATASSLNGVSGTGPDDVWAVGDGPDGSFIEHWNGQAWSQVASPANEPATAQLYAVSADGPTDAWAGGSSLSGPLLEHWNGTQWSIVPGAIGGTPGRVLAVAAISPTDIWAAAAVGKHNPPSIENWNGSQWSTVSLPTGETLHGLSAVSADDVWAVGNDGVILNWNGTQWSQVANPSGGTENLAAVDALSASDAWVISYDGTLTEQWNGTAWNAVPTASGLPDGYAAAGGFIWGGGSLSGVTGGPLFAVGGTGDGGNNETAVLEQPQP